MNEDLDILQAEIEKKKQENQTGLINIFDKKKDVEIVEATKPDEKAELINQMFQAGIKHEVETNVELQNKVLGTAKKYTETKMQVIETNVDTEHKASVFNNKKDACESYGFNEKTTPIWATKVMNVGYSIMLALWLFIGSFTFMPIIFIAKKISVGLKNTWLAVVFALVLYFGITFGIPILLALL